MITFQGIAVNTWVRLESDCWLVGEVVDDQAQLEFGHSAGSLHVVASAVALTRLVEVAEQALRQLTAAAGHSPAVESSAPAQRENGRHA